ncbi:MAG: twin-arginine translocation signal domain-containing protein [Maioricimonas sp. JB049]
MVNQNRREFLRQSACGAAAFGLGSSGVLRGAAPENRRPRIAAIYTELREFSHAYHILEPHMGPYLFNGKLTDPGVDVMSFYCDQYPENDMTREAATRLNMPMYETIAEALTCGGDKLAVDGVLLIGEHGDYPKTELGQVMYPRKEFFDQAVAVFRKSGRSVPVFNDKHLSYRWDWAKEMYDTAREMGFALMAGSSVPLAPRVPPVEFPEGAEVIEAVSVHGGGMESYDFHALEVMQSMIEFRKGGETGISDVQLLTREALMQAAADGLWPEDLFRVTMQTELEHRTDTGLKGPVAEIEPAHGLLLTYRDGVRAAVLAVQGTGVRWNFACRLKGREQPLATTWYPGPWGNRNLFRALSHAIQHMFVSGQSPYPVERTLLATGVLDAAMRSHHEGGVVKQTPHLEFGYEAQDFSAMREMGGSWEVITQDTPRPPRFEPGDKLTLKRIGR